MQVQVLSSTFELTNWFGKGQGFLNTLFSLLKFVVMLIYAQRRLGNYTRAFALVAFNRRYSGQTYASWFLCTIVGCLAAYHCQLELAAVLHAGTGPGTSILVIYNEGSRRYAPVPCAPHNLRDTKESRLKRTSPLMHMDSPRCLSISFHLCFATHGPFLIVCFMFRGARRRHGSRATQKRLCAV